MDNTIILATPRSGSNFLMHTLCDVSKLYCAGEFFSGGSSNRDCQLYRFCHLKYINWYNQHNYNRDYACKIYKNMFKILGCNKHSVKNRDAINVDHLILLINFIKDNPQKSWSHTFNKHIIKDKLLIKVFHNHYNYENHFDICEALEVFDNLIFLHRENVLNKFISEKRAKQTDEWFLHIGQEGKNKQEKITWNLEEYLSFRQDSIKWTKEHKKHLSDFTHKKTAIVKYEDIDKKNYKQQIKKILKSNDMDCETGTASSVKQAARNLDICDNFINKEEFLDDFPKIKNKILLKLEDL